MKFRMHTFVYSSIAFDEINLFYRGQHSDIYLKLSHLGIIIGIMWTKVSNRVFETDEINFYDLMHRFCSITK